MGVAGLNRGGETALDLAVNGRHDNVVRLMTRYLRSPLPPTPSTAAAPAHAALCAPSSGDDERQTASLLESNRQSLPTKEPLPLRHDGQRCEPPRNDETAAVDRAGKKQIAAAATAAASPEKRKAAGRTPPSDSRGVTRGGFYVAGAWSKAGECSCFNVRHRHLLGKHGVVFDMGVCPSEVRENTQRFSLSTTEFKQGLLAVCNGLQCCVCAFVAKASCGVKILLVWFDT